VHATRREAGLNVVDGRGMVPGSNRSVNAGIGVCLSQATINSVN
jgi:hypothetical protein